MSHVFISYSRDDEDKGRSVKSYLEDEGIEVFIDTSRLQPGDEWRKEIQDGLDNAFAVIVVCTTLSMTSQEVFFEWAYAMGQGTTVIPLIYERDSRLHSRLQTLHHLDFSSPRERPWGSLIGRLTQARSKYKPTAAFLKNAGIHRIFFSRDELEIDHTVAKILNRVKSSSELLVVARSCEAWARQYVDLQNALNEKSLRVKLAIVDPAVPQDQWMIRSDYAQLDITPTLGKFRMIKIDPSSKGSIELYVLPNSPLFSFISFVNEVDEQFGILEAGASLQLNERTVLLLSSRDANDGILLIRIQKLFARLLDGRSPIFTLSAGMNS